MIISVTIAIRIRAITIVQILAKIQVMEYLL